MFARVVSMLVVDLRGKHIVHTVSSILMKVNTEDRGVLRILSIF